jgi:hypothetical protein
MTATENITKKIEVPVEVAQVLENFNKEQLQEMIVDLISISLQASREESTPERLINHIRHTYPYINKFGRRVGEHEQTT